VVSSTSRPHFTPVKDPVPIVKEACWAPGPVWMGGKSRPHSDSLYRLSYPAHTHTHTHTYKDLSGSVISMPEFIKQTDRARVPNKFGKGSQNFHYRLVKFQTWLIGSISRNSKTHLPSALMWCFEPKYRGKLLITN